VREDVYWIKITSGPRKDRLGYVVAADVSNEAGRK
jgi:hypothetical protein